MKTDDNERSTLCQYFFSTPTENFSQCDGYRPILALQMQEIKPAGEGTPGHVVIKDIPYVFVGPYRVALEPLGDQDTNYQSPLAVRIFGFDIKADRDYRGVRDFVPRNLPTNGHRESPIREINGHVRFAKKLEHVTDQDFFPPGHFFHVHGGGYYGYDGNKIFYVRESGDFGPFFNIDPYDIACKLTNELKPETTMLFLWQFDV
ncbi:MAG: hypothetical protein HY832_03190 [Candidatus Aenigmarchaeota archaeon]|nr:hypothetical protein [Candidatus Aenigmarchaeota archaeon]